jgi:hypothetical protein
LRQHPAHHGRRVVQVEQWQAGGFGQGGGGICGNGHNKIVVRVARRFAGGGAPNLDFLQVRVAVAFDQNPVNTVVEFCNQGVDRQFGLDLKLAQQRQAFGDATTTSKAPASRWRWVSLPG